MGISKTEYQINFSRSEDGFTLIEVMVAFVIILITMLGLMNLTLQAIAVNAGNEIRDEAVRVAEEIAARMESTSYNSVTSGMLPPVTRNMRNFSVNYNPEIIVNDFGNFKVVNVRINWVYKGKNYTYTMSTIRKKG